MQILADNVTAVIYLSKQGGTRSKVLMELAHQILTRAETNLSSLSAVHFKGTQNVLADFLIRKKVMESEWTLNQEIFLMITGDLGPTSGGFVCKSGKCKDAYLLFSP